MTSKLPTTKAGWEAFCQRMADKLGCPVSVGYEEKQADIASAKPKKLPNDDQSHD